MPSAIHYNLVSGADEWGVGVHGKFDDLGRFADPSLLILTSLSDGPKHGYAIMSDVTEFSGVRMEPGTLYGALSRLERRGWVRPLATEERRRPYGITAAGQEILICTAHEHARPTPCSFRFDWAAVGSVRNCVV
jgi:Transcriptional regulator PadR-like family